MSNEQRKSMSRSIAAESEQLLGVVRRDLSHKVLSIAILDIIALCTMSELHAMMSRIAILNTPPQ